MRTSKKHSVSIFCILFSICCLLLTACGGPSKEKIAEAQDTYARLVNIHNQAVLAHKQIQDSSLDDKLVTLADKITQINTYHLNDMNDEEIDMLIETMDTIIKTYQEYLNAINQIKTTEDAAVVTPISISLINNTSITFTNLSLYQKGTFHGEDLLDSLSGFGPTQRLTGLVIYRDTSSTPWIMEIKAEDGTAYSLELSVKDYSIDGCILTLTYDSEANQLICG